MPTGKGWEYLSEQWFFRDRDTGIPIRQLTNHASINHPTYFLHSSFTPDGKTIVFTSYRTGEAQLFEGTFPHGVLRQLTDGPAIHPFSPAVHPDGQRIFFVRGSAIVELRRDTLAERSVVSFDKAQLGECSFGQNGEWLTAAIKQGSQSGIVAGRIDGTEWNFIPFPRTVIHPQFHPLEPEWIEFAGDPAPRMHRVRRDGTGLECLYEHGNDEFVVHETFLGQTGDLIYTVWPKLLCRFNWQTRERSVIAECNAWHISGNSAGSAVLCDTNHPDEGIFLIDVKSGKRELVCRSESSNQGSQWRTSRYALAADFARARSQASESLSWMETATDTVYGPQWTHPHPSFSFDESKIAFASDRTGTPQVYVAEIN